ncbi:serine--tRNA ligase [Candidatus Woesearchaeota archaeon CG10_big_fil_rev_8_21_14_0_10_34_8]|nr:MAG: serine--tRNA ligase [Candidatus Woesearchaeota archaeon CG10_big_fil_rev_8_21_14_0_10_34_8]
MLDIKLIRDTPDVVRADLEKRKDKEKLEYVNKILDLDKKQLELKQKVEKLRCRRNEISREIGQKKKACKDASELLNEAAKIPMQIETIEADQKHVQNEIKHYLMRLPNILHEDVPVGDDESGNKVIGEFGKKPSYVFEPKSHIDILEEYDWVDLKRAAKIAGARQYFLKGDLVLLDLALQRYAMDFMHEKGFKLMYPPFMMHRDVYEGVTDLKDFEEVMYKIQGEELYLIATSEHPMTAMYHDEILEHDEMPIKLCGLSTCFRKEAGAHGKDQKGIFRVHQFNKVEQVIICDPKKSWEFHEELLNNAKEFFESLGFHFRIVNICTGDIGTVAAKKYDIEVWYPVQNAYREVVSCSNCTDYQARRLKIRIRGKEGNYQPHTLNATCVATSRAIVAILENFQQKDGSIKIPDVLVPYMNGKRFLKP